MSENMNKEQEQNLQYNILKSIYNREFETLKKFGNPTFNQKEDFTYISIEISPNNKLDIYYNKNNNIVFQTNSQGGKDFSLPYEIILFILFINQFYLFLILLLINNFIKQNLLLMN